MKILVVILITLVVIFAALMGFIYIHFSSLLKSARRAANKKMKEAEELEERAKSIAFDAETYRQSEMEKMNLKIELIESRLVGEIREKATEEKKILYENIEADRAVRIAELNQEIENLKAQRVAELEDLIAAKKTNVDEELRRINGEFEADAAKFQSEIDRIENEVKAWHEKHLGAIESFKSLDELKNKDYYKRLQVSEDEMIEIAELRDVIKKLKNPMPFRKAVYEIYFANKVSDLVNNVVGRGRVSGIYKITEVESGRVYVGQSVDIGERWKQHLKRGSGGFAPTQNKLYPAMIELGIENFMFEVLETTEDVSKLGEMEKYWQEFFKAKEFGYSMK